MDVINELIQEFALKYERHIYGDWVKNYAYFAIKPLEVKP